MSREINKVIIVGGGSAGWMSAATFIRFFPDKEIVVIESPDTPTVGVGESTLGQLRRWTNILGIDEKDFMRYTNASYKLSIKFTDFYQKDAGGFHYPFGQPHFDGDDWQDWQFKKAIYPDTPVQDYCRTFWPAMPLIENNRFSLNLTGDFESYRTDRDVAYHFDAASFGAWLRERYCIPRGVKHIPATVVDIPVDEDGVAGLILNTGETVTADLYVDCTGWRSLLLGGALKEPFVSYNDMLPNNRAWATQIPYTDKEKELEPYTNGTAIENGWVWNIPMWTRIGTGYVYSDKFVSPEQALEEFKRYLNSDKMTVPNKNRVTDDLVFRDIHMRVGIHERTWVKNVVGIGLSAGFIEPLESNGLFSVHEFLLSLMKNMSRPKVTQWDIDTHNTYARGIFNGFAEFVALHYALSIRDDTEYWRHVTRKSFCPDMVHQKYVGTSGFADLVYRKMFQLKHTGEGGINCIATGMNYMTTTPADVIEIQSQRNSNMKAHVDNFIKKRDSLRMRWDRAAAASPTLMEYLAENIYK